MKAELLANLWLIGLSIITGAAVQVAIQYRVRVTSQPAWI